MNLKDKMSLHDDNICVIYRLHQSEEKCKVHGCINSSKFLVADSYTVKVRTLVHAGIADGPMIGGI